MVDEVKKPRRLWQIVLVCSLALNLAVAGVVIGAVSSGRVGDGPPRSFDLGVGPMARALLPQEQREIRRTLRDNQTLRSVDLRGSLRSIQDALVADPFAPEALRAALSDQRNKLLAVQGEAQDALIEAVAEMSPERRAAFAEAVVEEMAKSRQRGPRKGSGG